MSSRSKLAAREAKYSSDERLPGQCQGCRLPVRYDPRRGWIDAATNRLHRCPASDPLWRPA